MTGSRAVIIKFGAFAAVMILLTVFLFLIFGQYTTGSTNGYSALFTDVSRLKPGQTVRVAGIRVGTVNSVSLRPDKKVVVKFDADRKVVLTTGTRAVIRYLNLVGDRYLELVDGPGSTKVLPPGSEIPMDRTAPALDLDLLLGGLKPVTQGLNPQDVNALSASLIQVFQGEGGTLESLLSKTSSFSNALADNNQTVQELIDNLNTVVGTVDKEGTKFSGAIDRLEKLISGLSQDRDTIGDRHHRPGQRDRLDRGSAGPRPRAAGRHRRPIEPAGPVAGQRQEPHRRFAAEAAAQLPQTDQAGFVRRLVPVLPVRTGAACLRSAVPDGGSRHNPPGHRAVCGTEGSR